MTEPQSRHRSETCHQHLCVLMAFCCLVPLTASAQIMLNVGADGTQQSPEPVRLSTLPVDRSISRWLRQAGEAFEARDWAIFLERAQRILNSEQDSFSLKEGETYVSARQEVTKYLSQLPPEARELYDAQFQSLARQQLEQAKSRNDLHAIAVIIDRYPLTDSSWEAGNLLASAFLEEGRPALAARVFQDLLDRPDAAKWASPAVLVKLAAARAGAGDQEGAQDVIELLKIQHPGFRPTVGGKHVSHEKFLEVLSRVEVLRRFQRTSDWASFLGGPTRNPVTEGSPPFLEPLWVCPASRNPKFDQTLWSRIAAGKALQAQGTLPSPYAVAHKGAIYIKTFDGLTALDSKSGKLLWREATTLGRFAYYVNYMLTYKHPMRVLTRATG